VRGVDLHSLPDPRGKEPMTSKRREQVRAHLRRLFDEHDIREMPISAVWRLILQAEVYTDAEIEELCREAHLRLVARVLLADPVLRRRVTDEGRPALDDPFVQARLRHLIAKELEIEEEREGH
jgi:SpoVK/Ycf46/Vps4 family AAA+-type ATPase